MTFWYCVVWIHFGFATAFTLYLLAKRREPAVMTAWILGFFLVPFFSLLVYMFFGYQRFRRGRRRKPHPTPDTRPKRVDPARVVPADVRSEIRNVSQLAENLTHFPATSGNQAEIVITPRDIFDGWLQAFAEAKHHIHAEMFIWADDAMGQNIRDALIAAARRGVKCRVLVDSIGSWKLSRRFFSTLREAGIEIYTFSPYTSPFHIWHLHLRNHRKLTVIDGLVGFVGSANWLENFREKPKNALLWHDAQVRLAGPVVTHLQSIFLEDWRFVTKQTLDDDAYYPAAKATGPHYVQALPTGPDLKENTLHLIFSGLLHAAQKKITLISPYLVPSTMMGLALEGAARRGLEVSILLPARSDNTLTRWAGRSWYPSLLNAGVRIFEHPQGEIHAKVILIDDYLTLLGSANMDVRSFQLNFEAGVFLYGEEPTSTLNGLAEKMLQQAGEITESELQRTSWPSRVMEGLCRLLTPLL